MINSALRIALCVAGGVGIAACQSSGKTDATLSSAVAEPAGASTPAAGDTAQAGAPTTQMAMAGAGQPMVAGAPPAQCSIQLAGGPPPKPSRGADFGAAFVKDSGKAVGRGAIQIVGGMLGGGLGSAIGSGVAQSTIRPEGDIKGVWTITDGSPGCGCEIAIDSFRIITGKGSDTGTTKTRGCSSPQMLQVAAWALGHSFTGYDAKFELKAKDKKTVLATMNRDGAHYFSGTMANGAPVVMWREGQNYHKLSSFK